MYSLGNFATNMWSFLCELGMIESVEFVKDESGWSTGGCPATSSSTTSGRGSCMTTPRALVHLSVGRVRRGRLHRIEQAYVDFIERHVTGQHESDDSVARLKRYGAIEGAVLVGDLLETARPCPARPCGFAGYLCAC